MSTPVAPWADVSDDGDDSDDGHVVGVSARPPDTLADGKKVEEEEGESEVEAEGGSAASGSGSGEPPRETREVIILRGLPGVGKRKYVEQLLTTGRLCGVPKEDVAICSADDYYDANQVRYGSNEGRNAAYKWFKRQYYTAIEGGVPYIFLVNPHLLPGTINWAVARSKSEGAQVTVVDIVCATEQDAECAARASRRRVPRSLARNMHRKFVPWRGAITLRAGTLTPVSVVGAGARRNRSRGWGRTRQRQGQGQDQDQDRTRDQNRSQKWSAWRK